MVSLEQVGSAKAYAHESGDLNQATQLAMDIEDEITKTYEENYLAQPSTLSVSGYKAECLSNGFEPGKQKKDFRSGCTSYPPSPNHGSSKIEQGEWMS